MTNPTQQNQNPNKSAQGSHQDKSRDDMHNTGAQAKNTQPASKDSGQQGSQQRKDAPKQDQNR